MLARYLSGKVKHVWLIDPVVRSLEVFRLEDDRWTLAAAHGEHDKVRAEPFDAIELDLALLWQDVKLV